MVAIAATLFAVNGTVSKVILGSGISSGQLTAVRCAGALIGLALIAAATRPRSLRVRTGDLPLSYTNLGGGTLVMRALNEGDLSVSTVVRATDRALTQIEFASSRITIGAGVTWACAGARVGAVSRGVR
jgi:hypothetical protein